jgi:hypothetical protein
MAAAFVPSIIQTVERTMESLRLHEGLKPDDEALMALRRKVALEIGELELAGPRFPLFQSFRTTICKWPDDSVRA